MSTSAITFDQMERQADRTYALVLWTKHASVVGRMAMLLTIVSWALRSLIRSLSSERLESLSSEQAIELTKRLQETHQLLAYLSRMADIHRMSQAPVIGPLLCNLQESTEDLGDVIEDLVLSENEQFRHLVADCVNTLSLDSSTIGHM